jgi:hypothetical protein
VDLTTLSSVKSYLAISSAGQDALIPSLISRQSRLIEQFTGRTFPNVTRSTHLNGTGTQRLVLPDTPIISISSLLIDGVAVPASDGTSTGYLYDDTSIILKNLVFTRGAVNVSCVWTAGYQQTQTFTIPAGNTPTVTPNGNSPAVVNVGASLSGVAMSLVASAPSAGQYSFASGAYSFSSSDSNKPVDLTYYCVPADIEHACNLLVGTAMKIRDNLGISSKSLAGETISYSAKAMDGTVKELLMPYRRVAPA